MSADSAVTAAVQDRRRWRAIEKTRAAHRVAPNLTDYGRAWAEFSWEEARRRLDGLPGGRG